MSDLTSWYRREIHLWRTGASVVWTLSLLLFFVHIYLAISNIDLFHLGSWVFESTFGVFRLSRWFYTGMMAILVGILAIWNSRNYTVTPVILSNRLSVIWTVLRPSHVFHAAVHSLVSAMATWCCMTVIGGQYSGLSVKCSKDSEGLCLNEKHLFVVLYGAFAGYFFSVYFYLYNSNYITFPITQQSKFFEVKSSLYGLLIASATLTLRQLRYYYLLYYFLGNNPKEWILQNFNLQRSSSVPVDSIQGLLDLSLFWQVFTSGVFVTFILHLSILLYKVYHTEPVEFPIDSTFDQERNKCLYCVLQCRTYPPLQYLGFLDLYLLSRHSAVRRKEIFSLSQPGGHAHNWNYLATECLGALETLTSKITMANNRVMANGGLRQLSGDKGPVSSQRNAGVSEHSSFSTPVGGSLSHRQVLTNIGPAHTLTDANIHSQTPKPPSMTTKVWEQLKRWPAIAFFVTDLPDTASCRLFADCQKHIWAVEALSHLATASFMEDLYGVVQKSLPDIITAVLSLQEAIEKHLKLGTNISRRPGRSQAFEAQLRFALRSALKSSMYRIVVTFKDHLKNIPLGPEYSRRLKTFLEYKE